MGGGHERECDAEGGRGVCTGEGFSLSGSVAERYKSTHTSQGQCKPHMQSPHKPHPPPPTLSAGWQPRPPASAPTAASRAPAPAAAQTGRCRCSRRRPSLLRRRGRWWGRGLGLPSALLLVRALPRRPVVVCASGVHWGCIELCVVVGGREPLNRQKQRRKMHENRV